MFDIKKFKALNIFLILQSNDKQEVGEMIARILTNVLIIKKLLQINNKNISIPIF